VQFLPLLLRNLIVEGVHRWRPITLNWTNSMKRVRQVQPVMLMQTNGECGRGAGLPGRAVPVLEHVLDPDAEGGGQAEG
jgi:hypothetical protein